jgi:hypothetical protein
MFQTQTRWLLVCVALLALPFIASAQISVNVSVNLAPPALPVYDQPAIPADGYLWTPGYWAWDASDGYYWVPGTWIEPPQPGFLWTPGYWSSDSGAFFFHPGYWGEHIGFYGGVNYGFGYGGSGFEGGYWQGGHLYYNRAVMNVGTTHITNVYSKTVINNNVTVNRVSYNGGPGGTQSRATSEELAVAHERHIAVTPMQTQHIHAAHSDPSLRASANGGRPGTPAVARPTAFRSPPGQAAHQGGPAPSNAGRPREEEHRSTPPPAATAVRPANAPLAERSANSPPKAGPPRPAEKAPPPRESPHEENHERQ